MADKDKKNIESITVPTIMLCPHCREKMTVLVQFTSFGNLIDD